MNRRTRIAWRVQSFGRVTSRREGTQEGGQVRCATRLMSRASVAAEQQAVETAAGGFIARGWRPSEAEPEGRGGCGGWRGRGARECGSGGRCERTPTNRPPGTRASGVDGDVAACVPPPWRPRRPPRRRRPRLRRPRPRRLPQAVCTRPLRLPSCSLEASLGACRSSCCSSCACAARSLPRLAESKY